MGTLVTPKYLGTFFILLTIFSPSGWSSLAPSRFTDPVRKLNLGAADTRWDFFSGDQVTTTGGSPDLQLEFVARGPQILNNSFQSTLTMRVDKSDARSSRTYAEKWLKEFPKFGYELQASGEVTFGALEGYEMELNSTFSDRRVKQFVVKKPHEMWIFTCSSDKEHFISAVKDCEKILRTAKNIF